MNTQPYEHPKETNTNEFPLSIIPVSSQKTPLGAWTQYQTQVTPIDYWHSHYINQGTVGIICGKVEHKLRDHRYRRKE